MNLQADASVSVESIFPPTHNLPRPRAQTLVDIRQWGVRTCPWCLAIIIIIIDLFIYYARRQQNTTPRLQRREKH